MDKVAESQSKQLAPAARPAAPPRLSLVIYERDELQCFFDQERENKKTLQDKLEEAQKTIAEQSDKVMDLENQLLSKKNEADNLLWTNVKLLNQERENVKRLAFDLEQAKQQMEEDMQKISSKHREERFIRETTKKAMDEENETNEKSLKEKIAALEEQNNRRYEAVLIDLKKKEQDAKDATDSANLLQSRLTEAEMKNNEISSKHREERLIWENTKKAMDEENETNEKSLKEKIAALEEQIEVQWNDKAIEEQHIDNRRFNENEPQPVQMGYGNENGNGEGENVDDEDESGVEASDDEEQELSQQDKDQIIQELKMKDTYLYDNVERRVAELERDMPLRIAAIRDKIGKSLELLLKEIREETGRKTRFSLPVAKSIVILMRLAKKNRPTGTV